MEFLESRAQESHSIQESVAKGGGNNGCESSGKTREATDLREDNGKQAEQVCKRMFEVEQINRHCDRETHE
jgi:hypothetical protein